MFKALKEKFSAASKAAKSRSVEDISEVAGDTGRRLKGSVLDDVLHELEIGLLESDVALPVAEELIDGVRKVLEGKRIDKEFKIDEAIELALKVAVRDVLQTQTFSLKDAISAKDSPYVIMFVGINGTGKTTVIAKMANRLKGHGYSVVLAAADTFRAGAIEQLTIHSERLGCKIVKHQAGGDPAAVAYDAIEHAKARKRGVVLIDTAGRMQTNANLMDEMKKIKRVAKPDLIIFVGDSLAGSDAVTQAKKFDEAVGIDAVVLTKIDTDAKGGAALSIAKTVGKPIAYVSFGQEYDQFRRFDAEWMVGRIFGDKSSSVSQDF